MRYYHYLILVLAFLVTYIHRGLWWVSLLLVVAWGITFWLVGVAQRQEDRHEAYELPDDQMRWWKLR